MLRARVADQGVSVGTTFVKGSIEYCRKSEFRQFLKHYCQQDIPSEEAATAALFEICGISVRHELATNAVARKRYMDLIWEYNHMRRMGRTR
jgi:hypothetical protein